METIMSVVAEVEENNYTTMKYRNNRVEQDERELAELEAQRNKSPEQRAEEDEDANLDAEESTFKKRYGDLRRHMQRTQEENNRQLRLLQDQVESLTRKQVKLPKSDQELDAWAKKYPDVAKIVETIATKKAMEARGEVDQRLKRVEELETKIAREKAEKELARLHPDFDELRQDKAFHQWVSQQPKWIQSALYDNDTDFLGAAKAIDLYKTENGRKKRSKDTDAARSVPARSHREDLSDGKVTWSESRVKRLTAREYEKFEKDIENAIRSGNFDYDISGGAR
jgi:ABC-type phosphate transport system auxiliary subunit